MPTWGEIASRAAPYLEPIEGPSPAGELTQFDAEYEAVEAEVAKLESPTGGAVRWAAVADGSAALLRARTKDLRLAAYLARALHVTQGLDGLVTGTALLAALIERYGDTMQPPLARPRARANALRWFVDGAAAHLGAAPPDRPDPVLLRALAVAADRLGEVAREALGKAAPALGALLEGVAKLEERATAQAQVARTEPEPEPRSGGPSRTEGEPTAAGSAADPLERLWELERALVELAGALRAGSTVGDPTPFRILRVGLWLPLAGCPPAVNGRTALVPLQEGVSRRLASLEQNARWEALLEEAESALPQHRLALDLQRACWLALQGLGAERDEARAAVAGETRALLDRMPALPGLSFADGSPLASRETRGWLDAEVLRPRHGAAPAPNAAADPALGEGSALLRRGRVEEGLARLRQALERAATGRERFLRRLEVARACAAAGLNAVAKASYDALDDEVRAHRLERWEPALAVETWRGVLATSRELRDDVRATPARLVDAHRRLCGLDLAAAHEAWP